VQLDIHWYNIFSSEKYLENEKYHTEKFEMSEKAYDRERTMCHIINLEMMRNVAYPTSLFSATYATVMRGAFFHKAFQARSFSSSRIQLLKSGIALGISLASFVATEYLDTEIDKHQSALEREDAKNWRNVFSRGSNFD